MSAIPHSTRIRNASKGVLLPGSESWFIQATDPFHDYEIPVSGIPDHDTENSVVQLVKRKITITKPANLPAGATWGTQISSAPVLTTLNAFVGTNSSALTHTTGSNSNKLGTLMVASGQDGIALYPSSEANVAAWTALDPLSTREYAAYSPSDNDNGNSPMKLIAGGFEVHNDTADLYKSGSVTVYSMPQTAVDVFSNGSDDGGSTYAPGMCTRFRSAPPLPTDAALMTNARTWEAKQGVLVPFRLDLSRGTEVSGSTSNIPAAYYYDSTDLRTPNVNGHVAAEFSQDTYLSRLATTTGTDISGATGYRDCHIDTSGAYFSGLHEDTVLTLTIRFLVEVCPTSANPTLMSMASPTAPYDPKALELYCHTMGSLPPGCPVHMNEKGDWWRNILKAVAAAAPAVIGAVAPEFLPVAALASAGLTKLATRKQAPPVAAPRKKKVNGKVAVSRNANSMRAA